MPKLLITLGLILVALGLLWPWLSKMGLGRLPGDIVIERENGRFYFPITTSLLVSLILSLLLWLFRR
jgi:ribose/xylose/arabinose/galactoside ABC-type transport system permease subunit